jgi:predicted O-methyltransferase YrrM
LPRSKPARRLARSAAKQFAARSLPRKRKKGFRVADAALWYLGKTFTTDWTSWKLPILARLVARFRNREARVLEIGSWEGRSALFFVNYLPRARLTCVDTFAGGQEHQEGAAKYQREARRLRGIEGRFDSNMKAFAKRIEKIKAQSGAALANLGVKRRRFDIAYIDGGHRASEVYTDGALTWPMIERGGIVIFDDYQWREMPQRLDNPAPGINAFLKSIEGQYRIVHKRYLIAIAKR